MFTLYTAPVKFLSTPSVRRATDNYLLAYYQAMISIHALREEGDLEKISYRQPGQYISIHALREEGDPWPPGPPAPPADFYPRPP